MYSPVRAQGSVNGNRKRFADLHFCICPPRIHVRNGQGRNFFVTECVFCSNGNSHTCPTIKCSTPVGTCGVPWFTHWHQIPFSSWGFRHSMMLAHMYCEFSPFLVYFRREVVSASQADMNTERCACSTGGSHAHTCDLRDQI